MESQRASRSLEAVRDRMAKELGLPPEAVEIMLRRAQDRVLGSTNLNFTGGEFDPNRTQPLNVAETG